MSIINAKKYTSLSSHPVLTSTFVPNPSVEITLALRSPCTILTIRRSDLICQPLVNTRLIKINSMLTFCYGWLWQEVRQRLRLGYQLSFRAVNFLKKCPALKILFSFCCQILCLKNLFFYYGRGGGINRINRKYGWSASGRN